MKRSAFFILSLLLVTAWAARASATTRVTEPSGSPIHVALDAHGVPVPFTITAAGFQPGTLVYVEQCDGQPATAPNWEPTRDCDLGTSPAAVIVDASGRVRFTAGDRNHGFQPFTGTGPQSLFTCVRLDAAAPKSPVPEYRNCQIRLSTSNAQTTADQVMVPMVFGAGAGSTPSGPSALLIATIVVAVVAVIVLAVVMLRRRSQRVS